MEKKRQVFFVWNYLTWGGAQIYFLSIVKQAAPNWRFKVILPKQSKPEILKFFTQNGVEYEFIDACLDLSEVASFKQKLQRQWRRIRAEIVTYKHLLRYDLSESIVHVESAPWQSWLFLFLLSRRGNVFVTMHNALPENVSEKRKMLWKKRLNFLLKQKNFHFFAANQNAIESVKKYVESKYWDKLTLTRASINLEEIKEITGAKFYKNDLRRKFDLPEEKFIVLCVGQFIDRKGRWIFLEAASEIAKIKKDIFFVWLTPQKPSAEEFEKIRQFAVEDAFRIVLSESVGKEHADVLKFFRIADVFALPSLWEGLPIAVLEALALGIPVISTNINAIPEAVKNLETGILIEPGNSGELSEAILKLYEDENLRKKLAENGQKFVSTNFDEKVSGRIALENYEKCLAK